MYHLLPWNKIFSLLAFGNVKIRLLFNNNYPWGVNYTCRDRK